MLVLSRKQKQQIKIGDNIVITVLQIKGGSIRLGIEAPRDVHVMRAELNEFREPANQTATNPLGTKIPGTRSSGTNLPAPKSRVVECESVSNSSPTSEGQESADGVDKVLELKIHGGQENGVIAPTRLSEIVNAVVQS